MKIVYLISLLLAYSYQAVSHAHAVVTDYSLKSVAIQAQHRDQVTLNFNSKIELGLSQIFLVSKGDKLTLLKLFNGDKQGQIRVAIPPITAGDYALKLKVFAADGHLTEDIIHFTVTP